MKTAPRFIAVFPETRQVPQYLVECRHVVTMISGDANLPNPTPSLAQVTAHLNSLEAAEDAAHKGGPAAKQQRNVALGVVRNDMRLLKAYVQSVADADATNAQAIITSAGMGVGKQRARTKQIVGVKQGKVSGRVVLEARALRAPTQYRWQMSTDQKAWTDLPESFKSSITVDGLTTATVYYFRLRTMTRTGLSDWSVVVSIIVH